MAKDSMPLSAGGAANNTACVFTIINTFGIILSITAFISLTLVVNNYTDKLKKEKHKETPVTKLCNRHIDIAIIGAGAAGAYSAWKLAQKYPKRMIHLYEFNNRIGGKLYSVPIPGIGDFVADLGAMRFYREWHPVLFDAIDELGLTVINFTTPKISEKLYYLRGKYLLQDHLEKGDLPYNLREEERNAGGRSDIMLALWNSQFIIKGEDDPLKRKTFDGKDVYKLGAFNEWQKYGSIDAIRYLLDISGFDDWVYGNQNNAHVSDTEYEENPEPWPQYLTLKDGTDILPKRMTQLFLKANIRRNRLFLNHELKEVNSSARDIALTFHHTKTKQVKSICAKQVILALPQGSIQRLQWPELQNSRNLYSAFNSLVDIPSVKIFIAYDNPWWRKGGQGWVFDEIRNSGEDLKYLVTDLPLRMVIDIGEDQSTGKSLLLIYNDWYTNLQFWKHHLENGPRDPAALDCEFTPSVELINLTQAYLAKAFNISTEEIPKPYAAVAHAWYKAPYHNAWHMWSPGIKYTDIQTKVLKPLDDRDIYVVGEAYSDSYKQGWIEGAYDRVEAMLSEYFQAKKGNRKGSSKQKSVRSVKNDALPYRHFQSILMRQ